MQKGSPDLQAGPRRWGCRPPCAPSSHSMLQALPLAMLTQSHLPCKRTHPICRQDPGGGTAGLPARPAAIACCRRVPDHWDILPGPPSLRLRLCLLV
eukprot:1158144-Pelagomonas_calceolata.AAC.5